MAIPIVDSIIQGVVKSVSTLSTGSILTLEGDVINYTDATLVTRGITLSLGDVVIAKFKQSTGLISNIVQLQDLYDTLFEDYNEDNLLFSPDIKKRLQVSNCCAVKKGTQYFDGLKNGQILTDKLEQAEMMVGLANSIYGIIPEGEVSDNQATYEVIVRIVNPGLKTITLTIGSVVYSYNTILVALNEVAQELSDTINSFYPQSYPYYSIVSGENVVISGSDFSSSNDTAVTLITVNCAIDAFPSDPSAFVSSLFGGTTITQGENCITNEEIQVILNRLCNLCSIPCTEVASF